MASKPPAAGRGRPKGARNKVSAEVKTLSMRLLSPDYRKEFAKRLHGGTLPPMLEAMVWHYAYGKPTETHEHTGADGTPLPPSTFIIRAREASV